MSKMFSIYDSKTESFYPPFFCKHKGEALRMFADLAVDAKTNIGKYPADFTLFELGDFDESSAAFGVHKTPLSLGLAVEYAKNHLS